MSIPQSTVNIVQGFGVIGEFYSDAPRIVTIHQLNSTDASHNVVGRAFTATNTTGDIATVQAGGQGTFPFAGFLVAPKNYVTSGGSQGPLSPSLTLKNGELAQFCTMGEIVVLLTATASPGYIVIYDQATGELSAKLPSALTPAGFVTTNATVIAGSVSGVGLVAIRITPKVGDI